MLVHVDVLMDESEVERIRALLAATGEDTSIAAFVAVGAAHYIEDEERRQATRPARLEPVTLWALCEFR